MLINFYIFFFKWIIIIKSFSNLKYDSGGEKNKTNIFKNLNKIGPFYPPPFLIGGLFFPRFKNFLLKIFKNYNLFF